MGRSESVEVRGIRVEMGWGGCSNVWVGCV